MFIMNHVYKYSPVLRVLSLFIGMLSGGILLGSVVAEIEAADVPDLILHGIGVIVGLLILWFTVEFGTRRLTPTPEGLKTRLFNEKTIVWSDIREVRDGLFDTMIIVPLRGAWIVVWPFVEDFNQLGDAMAENNPPQDTPQGI